MKLIFVVISYRLLHPFLLFVSLMVNLSVLNFKLFKVVPGESLLPELIWLQFAYKTSLMLPPKGLLVLIRVILINGNLVFGILWYPNFIQFTICHSFDVLCINFFLAGFCIHLLVPFCVVSVFRGTGWFPVSEISNVSANGFTTII